jgi:hypothetical protein
MSTTNILSKYKIGLTEALSSSSIEKASLIIKKYLRKKAKVVLFRYPGFEQYTGPNGRGFGLRYYSNKKNLSVRFNWTSLAAAGLNAVESVDFWFGPEGRHYFLKFDTQVSLVKTLPIVAEVIANGASKLGKMYTMPNDVSLNESLSPFPIFEATESSDIETMVDSIIEMLSMPNFTKGKVYSSFKGAGLKIFDQLEMMYPNVIVKSGTKYSLAGGPKEIQKIINDKEKILAAAGCVAAKLSKASGKEKYVPTGNIAEIEQNVERLTFEKQLVDLENLVKLTVNGSANALFVSGKGGVGKTHTTEKILASLGLRDGDGYFKNTGSASAAGLYSLLFRYKNSIIFFDDSDDALGDQEARNLLKAATDTKKIRKLVWNKMGKNVADPDEMTDDEILDAGLIPRFFDFTGRIIFISNLNLDKLDPDGALRTRAFIINIDPTEMEIYEFMDKIVGDINLEEGLTLDLKSRKHVVDLLRKGKSKQSANLRKLSRGLNMYAGSIVAGVEVSDADLQRMIETYATPLLGFVSIGLATLHAVSSFFC